MIRPPAPLGSCLCIYSKTCVKWPLSKRPKIGFKSNYHLMQVQGEHSAILSTFIKRPFVIKIFVLSIFEWPFYTGFTVHERKALVLLYSICVRSSVAIISG